MITNPDIPDYPPAEADEQWCLALCQRIIAEAGPGGILEKDLREAFATAYVDAVLRGEVWRGDQ